MIPVLTPLPARFGLAALALIAVLLGSLGPVRLDASALGGSDGAVAAEAIEAVEDPSSGESVGPDGGPVTAASTDRWVVLATADGRFVLHDLETDTRREWKAPASPVLAIAIDSATGASPVVLLAVRGDSHASTSLITVDGMNGETLGAARLPGELAHLFVGAGSAGAYAVTRAGGGASRPGREPRWSLIQFDPNQKGEDVSSALDGEVTGAALSADGTRFYIASTDQIRSFALNPLRSSWQFRSPGRNTAIVPAGSRAAILVARGRLVSLFDPERLPGRDPDTGAFPADDSTVSVEIPFEAERLAVSSDGETAAALDAEGLRLALIDLATGRIIESRETGEAAIAVFRAGEKSLALFSSEATKLAEIAVVSPPPAPTQAQEKRAREDEDRTDTADTAHGSESGGAGIDDPSLPDPPVIAGAQTSAGTPSIPASGAPESKAAVTAAAQVEPPPAAGPAGEKVASTAGQTPAAPATPSAEAPATATIGAAAGAPQTAVDPGAALAAPPRSADPPVPGQIRGRITGEIPLVKSVVLFGPNSLLKLHARVAVGPDGVWSLPTPPEGRYRILLDGADGAQLSYSPPYWQITVAVDGISGIDFHVAGRINAR